MTKPTQNLVIIGWREWVRLPNLNVGSIKAKIDTGARTSSLHAFNVERFRQTGKDFVRFEVHPLQRSGKGAIRVEMELADCRLVKSSSGHQNERPVILTPVELMGQTWEIELTLANRDEMGFRMLLGRQAIRHRFLVDSGQSYCDSSHKPRRGKRI
ncbi:MAG: ATP-dependent zinc protease [Planctomycetaceae bacterium]|nr:ATP-dependent zinc protease [Planctomycetaceae bacterium]